MCRRVAFSFAGTTVGAAFDSATRSLLPVRRRSGRDELVLWGRREGEPGSCDASPTVPVLSVKHGNWDRFEPRWVKLYVDRYRIANAEGRLLWHEMPPGGYLQGVLVQDTDPERTQRVYIASVRVPRHMAALSANGRWPHVANADATAGTAAAAAADATVVPEATELPDPTVAPEPLAPHEAPARPATPAPSAAIEPSGAPAAEAADDGAPGVPREDAAGPAAMEDTIELSEEEATPAGAADNAPAAAGEAEASRDDAQPQRAATRGEAGGALQRDS